MDFNKSFAVVGSIGLIMFFGMFWILSISNAWINTPTNYSININMDEETKESVIAVSTLQKEILELQLKKLELEINNSLNQNITYGKNVSCMVGFREQEFDSLNNLWHKTDIINYYTSDECYIIH